MKKEKILLKRLKNCKKNPSITQPNANEFLCSYEELDELISRRFLLSSGTQIALSQSGKLVRDN